MLQEDKVNRREPGWVLPISISIIALGIARFVFPGPWLLVAWVVITVVLVLIIRWIGGFR